MLVSQLRIDGHRRDVVYRDTPIGARGEVTVKARRSAVRAHEILTP